MTRDFCCDSCQEVIPSGAAMAEVLVVPPDGAWPLSRHYHQPQCLPSIPAGMANGVELRVSYKQAL